MAADGYPESYAKGIEITGIPTPTENSKVFHAGTAIKNDQLISSGGRVLCAVGLGDNVTQAQRVAYEVVSKISWKDAFYRTDIGHKAISREK